MLTSGHSFFNFRMHISFSDGSIVDRQRSEFVSWSVNLKFFRKSSCRKRISRIKCIYTCIQRIKRLQVQVLQRLALHPCREWQCLNFCINYKSLKMNWKTLRWVCDLFQHHCAFFSQALGWGSFQKWLNVDHFHVSHIMHLLNDHVSLLIERMIVYVLFFIPLNYSQI